MILILLILPVILHKETPARWKIFASIAVLPLLVALILTQTRSSWLGFIAGVFTIGIVKSKKLILVLLILIIIFLSVGPSDLRMRAASIFDPANISNLTRIHMIQTGWRMFLDKPIFGFGDIDLKKYYVTYTTPIDEAEGGHLHNNFMMLLVTLGLVGFITTMVLFVKIFIEQRRILFETFGNWVYGSLSLGAFAGYVGFHINGLFEWNFGDHEIAVLLWFTLGISLVSKKLFYQTSDKS